MRARLQYLADEFRVTANEPWRHRIHYLWNRFGWRPYNHWVSACACCCQWCEDEE